VSYFNTRQNILLIISLVLLILALFIFVEVVNILRKRGEYAQ